jgi:sigma-B regulation protein RsbU (phosphoserine phosphatase)
MKKTGKSASRTRPSSRSAGSVRLVELTATLGSIDPGADYAQLGGQIARAVAAQREIKGVRLWRMADGQPAIWREDGKPGPPREAAVQKLFSKGAANTRDGAWMAPLGSNGNVLGVLEAYGEKSLAADTRGALELLAKYAGVAMAHTEKRLALQELSGIVEAAKKLNSTLDLGELINIILQMATRQTEADRGTVFLVDHQHEEIWSLVGLGLEQQEIRIPTSRGIAGYVARSGEIVNLKDVYADARFEREVDRRLNYQTRTMLCVPVRNKDAQIIGVLQLLNKRDGAFSSSDEHFLSAISDHVALALENARLHRELILKQRMERDLELARRIQGGLLPEAPPSIPGFDIAVSHRASQMVGGDYYDFVQLNPETMLTVIADVEGKGVASALVMANLQATLRALVAHLHSLERLVSSVNNTILADTRGGKFMTFFVAMLDQRNRSLHYINAGHVPPAVVKANGEVNYLTEGGMVMGVFPDVPYDRGFTRLEPGDIVVGCTDGITEAMDRQANEYGNERLVEVVKRNVHKPAAQIVETVLDDVERYSRGGPHDDDRILFVLKVL